MRGHALTAVRTSGRLARLLWCLPPPPVLFLIVVPRRVKVWLGQSRFTPDEKVAIKIINCERLSGKIRANLDSEISILRDYKHENIVQLLNVQVGRAIVDS